MVMTFMYNLNGTQYLKYFHKYFIVSTYTTDLQEKGSFPNLRYYYDYLLMFLNITYSVIL